MYAEHREQVIKKACPPFFGEVKVIVIVILIFRRRRICFSLTGYKCFRATNICTLRKPLMFSSRLFCVVHLVL